MTADRNRHIIMRLGCITSKVCFCTLSISSVVIAVTAGVVFTAATAGAGAVAAATGAIETCAVVGEATGAAGAAFLVGFAPFAAPPLTYMCMYEHST